MYKDKEIVPELGYLRFIFLLLKRIYLNRNLFDLSQIYLIFFKLSNTFMIFTQKSNPGNFRL